MVAKASKATSGPWRCGAPGQASALDDFTGRLVVQVLEHVALENPQRHAPARSVPSFGASAIHGSMIVCPALSIRKQGCFDHDPL